jgi:ABC-type sugar transport system ATPase subunit
MIAGLELPTSGEILIDGEDVSQKPASQRDIAFVFQMFALYPHLNVRRNISYPLVSQGLLPSSLAAQAPQLPTSPRGYVSDFAGIIPAEQAAAMTRLIEIVQAGSQGEIAVVTLPDIAGRDAGDVALELGRSWGVGAKANIGDRARNAGVVVLLVPKGSSSDGSGQIAISVGQGAEGFIPDAVAGDIRREATPYLAAGDYGTGLSLITARLAQRYSAEFGFNLDSTLVPQRRQREQGDRGDDLDHLPQHEADGTVARRHAREPAGHAARHQGPRHHRDCRTVQCRQSRRTLTHDDPHQGGHHDAHHGLQPNDPPW